MPRAMLFIDGTWLYSNVPKLCDTYGQPSFRIDFGKLSAVLAEELKRNLGGIDVDVVRCNLFGSYATNHDPQDAAAVQRRRDFFSMLREEHRYDIEIYPIDFRGRRLRRADRDPDDPFRPEEKCVDVALATSLLYNAALSSVYDVAIVVAGDQDYKPALHRVRQLGKRVALASIRGSCAADFSDPRDAFQIRDYDVVWLDDLLSELELKYERVLQECQSPLHEGDRKVWTTFHPRRGQRFYCPECQASFVRQREEALEEYAGRGGGDPSGVSEGGELRGFVKRKVIERGFGFIQAEDLEDYFFHVTDLAEGLDFEEVQEGDLVAFELKKAPRADRAGAAQAVRVTAPASATQPPQVPVDGEVEPQ